MTVYAKESFEWTGEFMLRVLQRSIFPGNTYDIQVTMDAVESAMNGFNPEAEIVLDTEHGGSKLIFPIKGKLVTFPFTVADDGAVVVKTAFCSQKPDIDEYRTQRNIKSCGDISIAKKGDF